MELHQLRYFVAVAEAGSMTVAARRCHVAQPSLSAQVRKLEASIGVQLFDRHAKGVTLTPAGELLVPKARRIIQETVDIESSLRDDTDAGVGTLAVGAIPTIAPYLLPPVIDAVRGEFPACSIRTTEDYTERLVDLILDNRIDVAVTSTPIQHNLIEVETLGTEPFVVAVQSDHRLSLMERVGIADLRREPMIVLNDANCMSGQLSEYCALKNIVSETVCEASQIVTVLELVRRGVGIAIVPELSVAAGHVDGVAFRPIARGDARRQIALIRRAGRTMSVLARSFAQHCADYFA